jgi:hypothetical protein
MTRYHIALIAIILVEILMLFLGCHGDRNNPLIPAIQPGSEQTTSDQILTTPVRGSTGAYANTPALWGLYEVAYNAETHRIEAIPLRGPAFALNVVHFLQPPAGSAANLAVEVLDDSTFLEDGRIDVRVILHHPFPGMDVFTGFDVCGVFITEGTLVSPWDADLTYANPDVDPTLLNPDGYTRWMNPSEFLSGNIFGYVPGVWGTSESSENSGFIAGATLNPYKYFCMGLSPDESIADWLMNPESVSNRGMFPSGASCARDYELLFPIKEGWPNFMFNYAVLANWCEPDVNPPEDPLTDFPIDANARYPLHMIGEDNSQVYYTPEDFGGTVRVSLNVFDWDALTPGSGGVPYEISKIVLWCSEPLIPGGYREFMSTDVEWNSGFTASMSVVQIEIPKAQPDSSGEKMLWIAFESANPSSYDQGFGVDIPDDRLASYLAMPIDVKGCPKAFMDSIDTTQGGTDSTLDDVILSGEDFVPGDDLGAWMELTDAGDSAPPEPEPFKIVGTDVKYIDSETISADFDLIDAPLGKYVMGCVNGCGIITTPEDMHNMIGGYVEFKVTLPKPINLTVSTGRTTYVPSEVTHVELAWDPVDGASYYKVYASAYDTNSTAVYSGLVAMTSNTYLEIPLSSLYIASGGNVDFYVTAYTILDSEPYESDPSLHGYLYYQGFETGLGSWKAIAEDSATIGFVRSTVEAAYSGMWGIKSLGEFPWSPAMWATLLSPAIPDSEGATVVKYELLHRHMGVLPQNGYQIGYMHELPVAGLPEVEGYSPISTVSYGYSYNSASSSALQSEFNVSASTDDHFGLNYASWNGWYLSGFDASEILGNGVDDYLVIGLAGDYFDLLDIGIDEVAIVVY